MGKLTISMAIFHSYVSHYQRVVNKMENCHFDQNICFFFGRGFIAVRHTYCQYPILSTRNLRWWDEPSIAIRFFSGPTAPLEPRYPKRQCAGWRGIRRLWIKLLGCSVDSMADSVRLSPWLVLLVERGVPWCSMDIIVEVPSWTQWKCARVSVGNHRPRVIQLRCRCSNWYMFQYVA